MKVTEEKAVVATPRERLVGERGESREARRAREVKERGMRRREEEPHATTDSNNYRQRDKCSHSS